jgi:hypothetical protein
VEDKVRSENDQWLNEEEGEENDLPEVDSNWPSALHSIEHMLRMW